MSNPYPDVKRYIVIDIIVDNTPVTGAVLTFKLRRLDNFELCIAAFHMSIRCSIEHQDGTGDTVVGRVSDVKRQDIILINDLYVRPEEFVSYVF